MTRWTLNKTSINTAICVLALNAGIHVFAQGGDVPPPLNPPDAGWATPPPIPGGPGADFPPGGAPPPPSGFDGFDFSGEDGFEDDFAGGGGASGNKREGKNSFQVVSPESSRSSCNSWGSDILGAKKFDDQGSCTVALEKKVEQGRTDIDEVHDRFERLKLKSVIRGQMDRKASEGYHVNFMQLRTHLNEGSKKGCVCRK